MYTISDLCSSINYILQHWLIKTTEKVILLKHITVLYGKRFFFTRILIRKRIIEEEGKLKSFQTGSIIYGFNDK